MASKSEDDPPNQDTTELLKIVLQQVTDLTELVGRLNDKIIALSSTNRRQGDIRHNKQPVVHEKRKPGDVEILSSIITKPVEHLQKSIAEVHDAPLEERVKTHIIQILPMIMKNPGIPHVFPFHNDRVDFMMNKNDTEYKVASDLDAVFYLHNPSISVPVVDIPELLNRIYDCYRKELNGSGHPLAQNVKVRVSDLPIVCIDKTNENECTYYSGLLPCVIFHYTE